MIQSKNLFPVTKNPKMSPRLNYNKNSFPITPAITRIAKIANLLRSRNLETTSFSLSSMLIILVLHFEIDF